MLRKALAICLGLCVLAGQTGTASAEDLLAPDIVVLCEPTLRHAIGEIGAEWRQQSGVPVRIFSAPTALMLEEVSHHIRSDLIIGEGAEAEAASVARKLIEPQTRLGHWRNRLVLAALGPGPTAPPPLMPGAAGPLADAGPIAIVDPAVATAGAHSHAALATLGLLDAIEGRALGVAGTLDAAFLLASGKARLALVYATDVAADPDLSIAARLPDEAYPAIVYWIAQTQDLRSPQTAKFAEFLRQPQAQAHLRSNGLEVRE